jgi:hypothetical protein
MTPVDCSSDHGRHPASVDVDRSSTKRPDADVADAPSQPAGPQQIRSARKETLVGSPRGLRQASAPLLCSSRASQVLHRSLAIFASYRQASMPWRLSVCTAVVSLTCASPVEGALFGWSAGALIRNVVHTRPMALSVACFNPRDGSRLSAVAAERLRAVVVRREHLANSLHRHKLRTGRLNASEARRVRSSRGVVVGSVIACSVLT